MSGRFKKFLYLYIGFLTIAAITFLIMALTTHELEYYVFAFASSITSYCLLQDLEIDRLSKEIKNVKHNY